MRAVFRPLKGFQTKCRIYARPLSTYEIQPLKLEQAVAKNLAASESARKALEAEKEKIERNAIAEYKKTLVNDMFGIELMELEIQNVKRQKNIWDNPEDMIENLNAELRNRRKWETEYRQKERKNN